MAGDISRQNGRKGRRKGQKAGVDFKAWRWSSTLQKEEARELARQQITAHLGRVIGAQVTNAIGIGHVYTRDKSGKFQRVVDKTQLETLLTEGTEGEHYYIYTKDPSNDAAKTLLDRALDRPKDQAQDVSLTLGATDELLARLDAGRRRIARARGETEEEG